MRKVAVRAFILNFSLLTFHFSLFAQVASSDEMLVPSKVGREGMIPVFASDISEGEYEIETESSSSMFRITNAKIFVSETDGENPEKLIRAKITLSGKSYTKLFLGTAVEASDASGVGEIFPLRSSQAQNDDANQNNEPIAFEFPIPALNEPVKCAAFSKNKEKWYDRDILFDAESLPETALFVSPERKNSSLKDGSYLVKVVLSGGSGKAKITSPAKVTVKGGKASAAIEWSSSNYDYMKVNGERFDVDTKILDDGGNSTFTIPIYAFNKKMPVFADTTAMSQNHEILYYLEFDESSAKKAGSLPKTDLILLVWAILVILSVVIVRFRMSGKRK